jgi:hypothetical protein
MSNFYQINWYVLLRLLLNNRWRKPRLLDFLKGSFVVLSQLYTLFLSFRTESLYKVRHNSQIVYLENVLNDVFDPILRRIVIQNAVFKNPIYFYEPEENKEVFFYEPEDNQPVYFREPNEFVGDGVDFFVFVPPDLQPTNAQQEQNLLTRMNGLINYYKLYSKNYSIVWQLVNV